MLSGKEQIDKLNSKNKSEHDTYKGTNSRLVTDYQNKKDDYNNNISIINAEKVSMRDELRKLHAFLTFVGGSLDRKVSIFDFVPENTAPNINEDLLPAVQDEFASDTLLICGVINKKRAIEFEKKIYWKSIDYKRNLKKKEQAISRMNDCIDIAKIYLEVLVSLKDAIRDKVIPEFEYIKAFLIADSIREKYVAGEELDNIKPCKIIEYKGTKYNSHYQFVKNAFDFFDLCTAFFSKPILTDLMRQEEVTEDQRDEFKRSIATLQDKLALLESDMEAKR